MTSIVLVGSPFPGAFERSLSTDPCFGKHFAKTAKECKACNAPVIVDGVLTPLRELCRARCLGSSSPVQLRRLTSQDVAERLERGQGVREIFLEVLGGMDPDVAGQAARDLLASRFQYIKHTLKLPVPPLPPTQELKDVRDP